ncbi:hypothetical protein KDU71_07760 [Carboxylicivirga sediminis]|uniref:Uncharacterized protein n=1 Tax=Carboxylicivirga sediminis TaxID=2006564 RepID=A0A941F2C2_9BACT|nr:hypothetical protein [Carboxylicivirga sediminis]MBR8535451.1 hypothetical protein [Carboxylicivirga sediminis]
MLRIEIHKSRSKRYAEVVELAHRYGAIKDRELLILTIEDYDLFSAYEDYFDLLMIICKWKTVKAYYRGEPVKLYRFILNSKFIYDCASERHNADEKYCWQNPHKEGWTCKKLIKISRYVRDGVRNYYEYGAFNKDVWRIDKNALLDKLGSEVLSSKCHLCPYFDFQNIVEIVARGLPECLIADGIFFVQENGRIKHKISIDEINQMQMMGVLSKLVNYGFTKLALSMRPGEKFYNADKMYKKHLDGYLKRGISLN